MQIQKEIEKIDLLTALSSAEMETITQESQLLTLRRRQDSFTMGVREKNVFIVLSGRLLLQIQGPKSQLCTLAIAKTEHILGELFLNTKQSTPQHVEPITTAELICIPKQLFKQLLRQNIELAEQITIRMAEQLSQANLRIADHSFLNATQKVAKIILHLSEEENEFVLPVTQKELASLIGISRENVNRSIKELTQNELITRLNGSYKIIDREKLRNLTFEKRILNQSK